MVKSHRSVAGAGEQTHVSDMARSQMPLRTRSHTKCQAGVSFLLTMGFCCSTVRSRSPCSQNSAATSRATCNGQTPQPHHGIKPRPQSSCLGPCFYSTGIFSSATTKVSPPPRGPPPPLCCLHRRGPKMVSMSCWRRPEQGWAASVVGTPRRLGCCHLYWNPPLLGSGGVHTLLCTSQGLVMAERSQAVIIMALDTRTPSVSLKPLMAMHTS